jgi:hypothetical protein
MRSSYQMGDWRSGEIEVVKAEAEELRIQTPGGHLDSKGPHLRITAVF